MAMERGIVPGSELYRHRFGKVGFSGYFGCKWVGRLGCIGVQFAGPYLFSTRSCPWLIIALLIGFIVVIKTFVEGILTRKKRFRPIGGVEPSMLSFLWLVPYPLSHLNDLGVLDARVCPKISWLNTTRYAGYFVPFSSRSCAA